MKKVSEIFGVKKTLKCDKCGFELINVNPAGYEDCKKCGKGKLIIQQKPKPANRPCKLCNGEIEPLEGFTGNWFFPKCDCQIEEYNKRQEKHKDDWVSPIPTETDRLNFDIMKGRHGESTFENFNLKGVIRSERLSPGTWTIGSVSG